LVKLVDPPESVRYLPTAPDPRPPRRNSPISRFLQKSFSPIPPSPIQEPRANGDEVRCRRGRSGHRAPPQACKAWLGRGSGCRGKRPLPTPLLSDVQFRIRFA